MNKKRILFLLAKIVFTIGLMLLVLTKIDFHKIWYSLKNVHLSLYVLAGSLSIGRIILSVVRWYILLKSKGFYVNFYTLVKYMYMSTFYSLFLPSVIGGDVIRTIVIKKDVENRGEAIGSVLVERFMGLFSLSFISFFALLFGLQYIKNNFIIIFIIGVLVLFIGLYVVLFNKKILNFLLRLLIKIGLSRFEHKIESFFIILYDYGQNKVLLLQVFLLSLLYQIIGIIVVYILGLAISMNVAFYYYIIFVPLIWMIMLLPISFSGFGIREGAFIGFFAEVHVNSEMALLLSVLFFSQMILVGLVGGGFNLIHLIQNHKIVKRD